jgi:hypothetical protein
LRVVRSSSLTPRRASRASSRRPITAGVTASILRRGRQAAARRRVDEGLDLLEMVHRSDSIPEVKDTLILFALIFPQRIE